MVSGRAQKRRVSRTLSEMLEAAAITMSQLDYAITTQASRKLPHVLRRGNDIVERLGAATDLTIVSIARRYRCFLVDVEPADGSPITWIYREVSPAQARFFCQASIPETAAVALRGQLLSALVDAPWKIASAMIDTVTILPDGWVSAAVSPDWIDINVFA